MGLLARSPFHFCGSLGWQAISKPAVGMKDSLKPQRSVSRAVGRAVDEANWLFRLMGKARDAITSVAPRTAAPPAPSAPSARPVPPARPIPPPPRPPATAPINGVPSVATPAGEVDELRRENAALKARLREVSAISSPDLVALAARGQRLLALVTHLVALKPTAPTVTAAIASPAAPASDSAAALYKQICQAGSKRKAIDDETADASLEAAAAAPTDGVVKAMPFSAADLDKVALKRRRSGGAPQPIPFSAANPPPPPPRRAPPPPPPPPKRAAISSSSSSSSSFASSSADAAAAAPSNKGSLSGRLMAEIKGGLRGGLSLLRPKARQAPTPAAAAPSGVKPSLQEQLVRAMSAKFLRVRAPTPVKEDDDEDQEWI